MSRIVPRVPRQPLRGAAGPQDRPVRRLTSQVADPAEGGTIDIWACSAIRHRRAPLDRRAANRPRDPRASGKPVSAATPSNTRAYRQLHNRRAGRTRTGPWPRQTLATTAQGQ
jgi:hypothetical protein